MHPSHRESIEPVTCRLPSSYCMMSLAWVVIICWNRILCSDGLARPPCKRRAIAGLADGVSHVTAFGGWLIDWLKVDDAVVVLAGALPLATDASWSRIHVIFSMEWPKGKIRCSFDAGSSSKPTANRMSKPPGTEMTFSKNDFDEIFTLDKNASSLSK